MSDRRCYGSKSTSKSQPLISNLKLLKVFQGPYWRVSQQESQFQKETSFKPASVGSFKPLGLRIWNSETSSRNLPRESLRKISHTSSSRKWTHALHVQEGFRIIPLLTQHDTWSINLVYNFYTKLYVLPLDYLWI